MRYILLGERIGEPTFARDHDGESSVRREDAFHLIEHRGKGREVLEDVDREDPVEERVLKGQPLLAVRDDDRDVLGNATRASLQAPLYSTA